MNYELKELNLSIGKLEYDMYQDIPKEESGSHNNCYGVPYEEFHKYIQIQMNRKNNKITTEDTPVTTFIMYVDEYPVGVICLRTKIDDNWKKWSGNFYYVIRLSERNKGYGTKMLQLAIKEFKKLGFSEIYGQASAGNISSAKVIENNGGILIDEVGGSKYYKIIINESK